MDDQLIIGDKIFTNRLILGSGKFSSPEIMLGSIKSSATEMVTLSIKRIDFKKNHDDILFPLQQTNVTLLPNTAGARNAKEAILAAQLSRELLNTHWVKLEIHPDPRYLMPDPIETLCAAKELCKQGFIVLPYIHADPVLCKKLEEVGCAAVMPIASPIGTNQGIETDVFLKIIIEQSCVPVIIDAGIGAPSQAAYAIEIGADAVLINTAIASSHNPELMAKAFCQAVSSGRYAYLAGLGDVNQQAQSSSPLTEFLDAVGEN